MYRKQAEISVPLMRDTSRPLTRLYNYARAGVVPTGMVVW